MNRILTKYIKEYLMLYKKLDIKSEVNQKVAIELEEQMLNFAGPVGDYCIIFESKA